MAEIEEGEYPVCGLFPAAQEKANEALIYFVLRKNSKSLLQKLCIFERGTLHEFSNFAEFDPKFANFEVAWFEDPTDPDVVFVYVHNWTEGGQATAWCSKEAYGV